MNLKELSPDQKKYIAIGVLGLILVLCIYFMMGNKEEDQKASFEKPEIERKKQEYESRIKQAQEPKNQKRTSLSDYFDDEANQSTENTANDSLYSQEEDPRVLELQRQIEEMETQKKKTYRSSTPKRNTPKKTQDDDEAYLQELIKAKEEMLRQHEQNNKRFQTDGIIEPDSRVKEAIEFRASVYQDQYILPGDRVKLVLNDDLIYNKKRFPKGTFIYAFATSIEQSRVFLEVDNIAFVDIDLVVKDITDGRFGMYSTRAGELWLEYKDEIKDDANNDIANAASDVTNSSLVGATLKGLASFFKRKRIRKRDKIPLINDQEVILTNKFK